MEAQQFNEQQFNSKALRLFQTVLRNTDVKLWFWFKEVINIRLIVS